MRKTKWFERVYSVSLALVLLLQIFTPIVDATTTDQVSDTSTIGVNICTTGY